MIPVLSVIIPCYNAGKYIGEMLDCCIKQSFMDWEVIVIDDGSTDGITTSIIKKYSDLDDRIIFEERNRAPKGGDTCRNIGLGRSRGKYVIFFDADDLISEVCFEQRVAFMEKHPDCDYASFPSAYFKDGESLPTWEDAKSKISIKKGRYDNLYYLLTYNYPFAVWSNIYRKDSIKALSWDENVKVMQDFDWMVSCELAGLKHKYSNTKQFDYYYRQFNNGHNVCGSFIGKEKCDSCLYLFDKTLFNLKKNDLREKRYKQLFFYVTTHLNRLIVGGEDVEAMRFIDMCKRYYSSRYINRLNIVSKKCIVKDRAISPLRLYYYCFIIYKERRFFIYFLKNLIKKLLDKEQLMYQ